jgi:hypothetical protein
MNSIFSTPSGKPITQGVVQPQSDVQRATSAAIPQNSVSAPQIGPKRVGYGLPCSKCKTYYAADLKACPICKNPERISAKTISAPLTPSSTDPDAIALEEERERFLREFKAQVYASHTQINAAASFRCNKDENHQGGYEPAAVCQPCHNRLQERTDLMEAALHIDLKEAAQVIYDAVWSDPSDPSKTYLNAAHAILSELRKRAGIGAVLGPLKPRPH